MTGDAKINWLDGDIFEGECVYFIIKYMHFVSCNRLISSVNQVACTGIAPVRAF